MPNAPEISPEEPMNLTMDRRPSRTIRRMAGLALMLSVALTVGACTSKTPAEQAQEELNAGLAADVSQDNLNERLRPWRVIQ